MNDTRRLEWLVTGAGAQKAAKVMGSDERGWGVCDCSDGLTFMSRGRPTFRDAIDAAILFVEHAKGKEAPR
jgi:hypothetical protein